MRERVIDWKREWIESNGETNELEVVICQKNEEIYAGSFREIPVEMENYRVLENWRILDSSEPNRIGAYTLKI